MDFDDVVDKLKTERDELRLRAHLMKAEIHDEFQDLERKWEHLESHLGRLKAASKESAEDVGAALKQLTEELAEGYRRVKKSVQ
jgi:seryl-tRNA synthetase